MSKERRFLREEKKSLRLFLFVLTEEKRRFRSIVRRISSLLEWKSFEGFVRPNELKVLRQRQRTGK